MICFLNCVQNNILVDIICKFTVYKYLYLYCYVYKQNKIKRYKNVFFMLVRYGLGFELVRVMREEGLTPH